jgi:hypothetical protein
VPALPTGALLTSRSIATVQAQASTPLFPANPNRHYLAFQAPAGNPLWVNFMGGIAAPNAVDCAYFAAGAFYESSSFVNRGSITIWSPVAATVSAWEG